MTAAERDDLALLRLGPGAGREEIERAYRDLRALYEPGSVATYGLLEDDERLALLERIDGAYRNLTRQAASESADGAAGVPVHPPLPDAEEAPGAYLRAVRERRGVSLEELSEETKIRAWLLQQIEGEVHANLPAPVYVRGFVRQVAALLGIDDPDALARVYLERMG